MKDLGELSYYLGIQIQRDWNKKSITISQTKYIDDVLQRFGMSDCHSSPIPMDPAVRLSESMSPQTQAEADEAEQYPYREIVGSLMYLMVSTRPDLAFSVGQLARFMNTHGKEHHLAAKTVLRYIKETRLLGITYGSSDLTVTGYSDADWASNIDTRRSTTGYVYMLAGGCISWRSQLQKTVALSSCEAEYMALTAAAKEAMYFSKLLKDLNINYNSTLIHEDNQGAIAMAQNPCAHDTAKHIAIKEHFIRDCIDDNVIQLKYISTEEMLADCLTKELSKIKLYNFRDIIMGIVR